jgi:hypothetical protein
MRLKKRKNSWKHDAGDAAFDVFFECVGALWKGLRYLVHIVIVYFEHK